MSERTPTPRQWLTRAVQWGGAEYHAALAEWEADRARLATLEARVAALVPLARWGWDDLADSDSDAAAAALAAIAAEQTTTTGGQDDA
jgi:uncharacterized glyoxalase superfamily metalloenzyme YdcJ